MNSIATVIPVRQIVTDQNPMTRGNKIFIGLATLIVLGGTALAVSTFSFHLFDEIYGWVGLETTAGGGLLALGGISHHDTKTNDEIKAAKKLLWIFKKQLNLVAEKAKVKQEELTTALCQIASKPFSKGCYLEVIGKINFLIFKKDDASFPIIDIIANPLGQGGTASVSRLVCLNDTREAALKRVLYFRNIINDPSGEIAKMILEGEKGVENEADMLLFLNRNGAQEGVQGAPFYSQPLSILTPEGFTEKGLKVELYDGDLFTKPPKTEREFKKFLSDMSKALIPLVDIRHGDIKPPNIFRKGNDYHMADWGSAIRYSDLKIKFQEAYQEWSSAYSKEQLTQKAKICARDHVLNLRIPFAQEFLCAADNEKLIDAFIQNDWKTFFAIEKTRDIYALALSFVLSLFDVEEGYDVLKQIKNSGTQKAFNLSVLTSEVVERFEEKGLSDHQIDIIDRMLGNYDERPSAEEISQAFNDIVYQEEASTPTSQKTGNLKNHFVSGGIKSISAHHVVLEAEQTIPTTANRFAALLCCGDDQ